MIIKCPHCYARVLPKKDNTCPSCCNNILDVSTDMEYDLAELKCEQKLPDVCIICGESTNNRVKIRYSRRYGSKYFLIVKLFALLILLLALLLIFLPIILLVFSFDEGERKISIIMILLALPISMIVPLIFLFLTSNPRRARIKLYLPSCKNCSKKERLKPKYIDYANYSVTFVAHKNFIDAFHK